MSHLRLLGATDTLLPLIPKGFSVETIDRNVLDPATARAEVLAAINAGPALLNYFGHGSVDLWRDGVLTNADVSGLTNDKLPVFLMMTCLNGYFAEPALDSLAVSLLKSAHGGVAAWASSGLVEPQAQALLDQALYRELFPASGPTPTLGEAMARAKTATTDPDVRRTWILLGDPTTRLR